MDEEKPGEQYRYVLRQSIVVLVTNLLVTECIVGITSLILRMSIKNFGDQIDTIYSSGTLYIIVSGLVQIFNVGFIIFLTLKWSSTQYIIKPKDLILQTGILTIKETVYSAERIESTNVSQGICARIWNYGNVRIFNPLLKTDLILRKIPNPYFYAEIINNQKRKGAAMLIRRSQ